MSQVVSFESKQNFKQTNLSVFKLQSNNCSKLSGNTNSKSDGIIYNCSFLQRITAGLRYYELLCNDTKSAVTQTSQDILVQFNTDTYNNFLDDYHHLIKYHEGDDLFKLSQELNHQYGFTKCDIITCKKLQRHYRSDKNNQPNNNTKNSLYNFYADCYDRCHHHIFHLFEMGLRFQSLHINNDKSIKSSQKNDDFDYESVDILFQQRRDVIKNRRHKFKLDIQRYNDYHNKYNIQIENQTDHSNIIAKTATESMTFLDRIFQALCETNETNQNVSSSNIVQIKQYVRANQYDSDALMDDLHEIANIKTKTYDTLTTSNIYQHIISTNTTNTTACVQLMAQYVRNVQLSSVWFATGFIFFYWDFYKQLSQEEFEVEKDGNNYDLYNGYSISDLLIAPYHSCLKEEILASSFVNVSQWNENVIIKGKQYYETERIKNIKSIGNHRYEINWNDTISLSHICSVILYCDMSSLCTHFSATFRKKDKFETIESLTARHSKYYYFAKTLTETILFFGITGFHDKDNGPFYCGLSCILYVPTFAIYLKGPCSTSKNIEVALNFAKRDGIILSLQNDTALSGLQHLFDCSWISKFSEENERLFIAAEYRLRIEGIRIIETAQNFQIFFPSLYAFDAMLSGENMHSNNIDVSSTDIKILNSLITGELDDVYSEFDPYIIDTFHSYLLQKTQIKIRMQNLKYFKVLSHLIMFHVKRSKERIRPEYNENSDTECTSDDSDSDSNYMNDDSVTVTHYDIDNNSDQGDSDSDEGNINKDLVNVLNTKILPIFSNCNEVIIDTGDLWYGEYRFNFLSFLSSIETNESCKKYVILATREYDFPDTWLDELDNVITSSIKHAYDDKKWNIKHASVIDRVDGQECVSITISK